MAKKKDADEPTVNTSLRLTKKKLKRLKTLASNRDLSLQKLLSGMIDDFIAGNKK